MPNPAPLVTSFCLPTLGALGPYSGPCPSLGISGKGGSAENLPASRLDPPDLRSLQGLALPFSNNNDTLLTKHFLGVPDSALCYKKMMLCQALEAHTYNPSTWEAEIGRTVVQGK
jgi:hypothetical protein